ncbi:alpha/beta fold hydrolase [Photobacterium japonica]|uniref:alpha/beta fold hydrolase n=1 Tax=Photobacterium japonica TaxID=2910235 RepID=UPI003D0D40F5
MHYQDIGEGPVLVFGHSYLWDHTMWAAQVAMLSQSYRCIVPDCWGHGQSAIAPSATRNLADYANDVLALLDSLSIETFSLVGLSSGGMWATEITIQAPSRVKALVLMDTFVAYEPQVAHAKYFNMIETVEREKAFTPEVVDFIAPLHASTQSADSEWLADFKARLLGLDPAQACAVAGMGRMVYGRRDMFEDAEAFALPTLIMVGAEDKMRPVLESYLMHDGITGSELLVLPGAGHMINLEQPEIVNAHLSAFLNKHLLA